MDINRPTPVTGLPSPSAFSALVGPERPASGPLAPAAESQFTPTADFTALLAAARQVPEVRQELIAEVARRLNSGEMFLPPSPDQVVGSLLESGALGDL